MTPDELQRLGTLERQMREHFHSGLDGAHVNFRDILGKIQVVSTVPIGKPTTVEGQFKIYTNGTTFRFYWYDTTAGTWHYVTATA